MELNVFRRYVVFFLCSLFFSCTSEEMEIRTVERDVSFKGSCSSSELTKRLQGVNSNIILTNEDYEYADMSWLKNKFNSYYLSLNQRNYSSETEYDCDDNARLYCALAQACSKTNLAVGEFWYKPDNSPEYHAIVAAYAEDGLHFIEPQKGWEINLSESELSTCSFFRM